MAMLAAVALFLLASHCTHDDVRSPEMITLAVPEHAAGTAMIARVDVGPLPRGARVVVRLASGELLGSIAPYGGQAAASGGTYTIPIPAHATRESELALRFEVQESNDSSPRPAKAGEVVRAELHAPPAAN